MITYKYTVINFILLYPVIADVPCVLQGYSRSETWYALLDYGTNYCNLHNLITGKI